MENIEEVTKTTTKNTKGFVEHVFDFDDNTKNELMNIVQYAVLCFIPIVGLNKIMKHYIPDVDEDKSSLEISFEIVGQMLILFIGLFYIHRLVTFVPTYSNQDYAEFHVHSIILVAILIISSLHTKLGEKSSILAERLFDLWNGETNLKQAASKEKTMPQQSVMPNPHMPAPQPVVQVPNHSLGPPPPQINQVGQAPPVQQNFVQNDFMAANEALGGGFGSAW